MYYNAFPKDQKKNIIYCFFSVFYEQDLVSVVYVVGKNSYILYLKKK